nr:tape measure protein [uncultured Achromobacter sp.]
MANNLRDIVVAVKVDTAAYQREMNRLSRMSGDYLKLVEQGGKRIDAAYQRNSAALAAQNASVGEATQVVAVYARSAADVFSSTAKILQYADSWAALNSRLQLVTNGAAAFQDAQSGVFNAAQQARMPLQATAELYQGIASNQDALGLSGQRVASVVETMGKSIALSGGSSTAAGAALSQLGQAFSAGTLNGEQLNAVMQQAPGLAMAIAEGLGMPIGELRALGAAGLLTADQVISAVESMAGSVDAQFATMPTSVRGAFTVLENAVIAWIGHTDEATGASKVLSDGILALSDHVDDAAFIAGAAAVGALTAKLGQSGVQAVQATKSFVENRLELQSQAKAQMLASQAAARKAQNTVFLAEKEAIAARGTAVQTSMELQLAQARMASRGATVAATAATAQYAAVSSTAGLAGRAILGLLGGPVGLAVSLASVAAGWLMFRDNAAEASQSMNDMRTPLEEVAKKHRELNALERDKARRGKQLQIVEAQGGADASFKALTDAARRGATRSGRSTFTSFQAGIEAVHADKNLDADQASEQIQAQIDAYVHSNPAAAAYRDRLVDIAAQYIKNRELLERNNAELRKIDGAQIGAAASAGALGDGLHAVGKELGDTGWESYLKSLESSRDLIGMTSSQIAEYQARKAPTRRRRPWPAPCLCRLRRPTF